MKILAFDSGIGGLSAIAPLFAQHPGLEVTYLGDLANLPYGTKSPARVAELTSRCADWLLRRVNAKADHFVIACNTASSHALDRVRTLGAAHNIPVTGVIEPGCRLCLKDHPSRVIVLGTAATVSGGSYERTLRAFGYTGPLVQKACPLFVPLVEDDLVTGPAVDLVIRRYLDDLKPSAGDAVILGCTHYPFLTTALTALYPHVRWIDAGSALLREKAFAAGSSSVSTPGSLELLFTDTTASREAVDRLLHRLSLKNLRVTMESVGSIA